MDDLLIRKITEQVLAILHQTPSPKHEPGGNEEKVQPIAVSNPYSMSIPVGVSARHIHLCREDLDVLFGIGYQLTKIKDLPQPGEFVAKETVSLVGPKSRGLEGVRILGDLRPVTQVEVSRTDAYVLGITPVVRKSGDTKGSPGITLIGPVGSIHLDEGIIIANRHIHMNPRDAMALGVSHNDEVDVRILSAKPTILGRVQIRVQENANLYMHIDLDDANGVAYDENSFVEIANGEVSKCCWQG